MPGRGRPFPKGITPWNKGMKGYMSGHPCYGDGFQCGENNILWKGDDVGKKALHRWVRNHLSRPEFCEICKTNLSYELANITGVYTRDSDNWMYLCIKCHRKLDYDRGFISKNRGSDGRFVTAGSVNA